jgi:hypothetical protein
MQLTLAILDPSDPPQSASTPSLISTPWDQFSEASRLAALGILARLIARMLAAEQGTEASND